MKIIVFGAGNIGKKIIHENIKMKNSDEIVLVVDNDQTKWGTYICEDFVIHNPHQIPKCNFDRIVVTCEHYNEIHHQLEGVVPSEILLSADKYIRNLFSRRVYYEKYNNKEIIKNKVFSNKIIVYTAITGDYDVLFDPVFAAPNIEYICFTNNHNIATKNWNIQYINDNSLSDMMLAKKVKVFPHLFLPKCDTSVWIDGKFQVTDNLSSYIHQYEKTQPILCFPHFARKCIFDEAATCVAEGIGKKQDIIHQISEYEHEGYPYDNGLYEMGCIVRRHNDPKVISIMEKWWNEIEKYSYRDQISFPYVCWKNDFHPDICDQDLYGNRWLKCTRNYCKAIEK